MSHNFALSYFAIWIVDMRDSYCEPLLHNGKYIYGAAARNVRIKEAGGLEAMVETAAKLGAMAFAQNFLRNKGQGRK